jgi:hypothetical protein
MAAKTAVILLLLLSCSTLQSEDKWQTVTIAQELRDWRWCSLDLDGPNYADLGWCWIGKECRKRFLRSDECRPKPEFCAAADIACIKANGLDRKVLVSQ